VLHSSRRSRNLFFDNLFFRHHAQPKPLHAGRACAPVSRQNGRKVVDFCAPYRVEQAARAVDSTSPHVKYSRLLHPKKISTRCAKFNSRHHNDLQSVAQKRHVQKSVNHAIQCRLHCEYCTTTSQTAAQNQAATPRGSPASTQLLK
jgi:hypothetical protein